MGRPLAYGADGGQTVGVAVGLLDGLRGRQAKGSAGSVGVPFHFAVVDLETTGLDPAKDRVIEVAIVLSDSHGHVLHEWCTLVNPGATFGAGHIHRIEHSWLAAAPTFADLAAEVGVRLNGRVLVGHNANFDADFLEAEFKRAGHTFAASFPVLDTMNIATAVGLPGGLQRACEQIGYTYSPHSALEDARATTALLHRFLPVVDPATFDSSGGSPLVPAGFFPAASTVVAPVARGVAARATIARDVLADAIYRLPPHDPSTDRDPAAAEAYLDVLAAAVADGYVSPEEFEELVGVATRSGLSEAEVRELHHEFVLGLLDAALGDRKVSKAERGAIERAATWLGVDLTDWDAMLKAARKRVKQAQTTFRDEMSGKTIAFVGRGLHPNNIREALALKHAMIVKRASASDLDLLVVGAADLATAAVATARGAGVPIMVEQGFWERLGEA